MTATGEIEMKAFGSRLLLAWVCLFLGQGAQAASFNCSQARRPVERMICDDARLSALDDQLASAYQAATSADGSPQIRVAQRNWIARRDRCAAVSCVMDAYEQRLAELSGADRVAGGARPAETVAAAGAENGMYCKFGRGNSYDMLLVRQGAKDGLLFGLSSWTPSGSHFGVAGTARRVGAGWRYEADMSASDPGERCAVTIDRAADGTYRVATVEGARCEAMAGHGAVLYGTNAFSPASRVGDAPASITMETLMQVGCDRRGRPRR
jgi:uncharacterized protein YecT (DUF1311 family)